jgi:hypothetical protein
MNTEKLLKAIQIIVEEEVTRRVPKLVKEGVKREFANLLRENRQLKEALNPQPQKVREEYVPTYMDDDFVVENKQPQKSLSKNPVLNEVLSQTVGFNSSMAQGGTEMMRSQMAAKMGYGDISMGAQPNGIGVDMGNELVNKAVNRNYSDLLKAMDKKKGPFRPGM